MPAVRLASLIVLVVSLTAPAARAQSGAPVPPGSGPEDVRQVLLRNGVRLCGFYVKGDASGFLLRDAYGNDRPVNRSEIAQMHSGSRARQMCKRHLLRAPAPAVPTASPGRAKGELKSESKALTLSIAVPAGAVAMGSAMLLSQNSIIDGPGLLLIGAGLFIGPSAGHFYTGDMDRVGGVLLIRTVMLGIGALGLASSLGAGLSPSLSPSRGDGSAGLIIAGLSGVGLLGLGIGDMVDAPASARRANGTEEPTVALLPMITDERALGSAPVRYTGLRLATSF